MERMDKPTLEDALRRLQGYQYELIVEVRSRVEQCQTRIETVADAIEAVLRP